MTASPPVSTPEAGMAVKKRTPLDGVDIRALDAFSECGGFVRMGEELVVVVRPRGTCRNHMAFDRRVCAAGLRRFVRRVLPDDTPADAPADCRFRTDWLLVTEAASGVRTRMEVECHWPTDEEEQR